MIKGKVLCGKHSSRGHALVRECRVHIFIKWGRFYWGNGRYFERRKITKIHSVGRMFNV